MKKIRRSALYCTAAVAAIVLLFGTALTAGRARIEKSRYIQAEEEMARRDLCAAVDEMLQAISNGDETALNRAAGKAEAYLSRAGLGDCGEIYRELQRICSAEHGAEDCKRLADAVRKAANGDGGEALREISGGEIMPAETEEETTEDQLSSRMMERLGKGRDDIALHRAQAFACPNAEFDGCKSGSPLSFAYSGENVFVLVAGETPRVVMYCFDRDTDERYSVTQEEAIRNTEMLLKREKLRLGDGYTTETNGVYRTLYYAENDLSDTPLVTVEIYSDTGRLRLYDAVSYYENLR